MSRLKATIDSEGLATDDSAMPRRTEPWRGELVAWRDSQTPAGQPPLSQELAAILLGVSSTTLSRWESGRTSPRLDQAAKIEAVTKVVVYEREETLTMRLQVLEAAVKELVDVLRGDVVAGQRKTRLDAVAEALALYAPPARSNRPPRPHRAKGPDG